MASIATNTNVNGMNRKQLRALARNIGVAQHLTTISDATLRTNIKAK